MKEVLPGHGQSEVVKGLGGVFVETGGLGRWRIEEIGRGLQGGGGSEQGRDCGFAILGTGKERTGVRIARPLYLLNRIDHEVRETFIPNVRARSMDN